LGNTRWIVLDSTLNREEILARLSGRKVGSKRVWPRFAGTPAVLSIGESSFTLRAFGFWKRYGVEGTIEAVEGGSRIILQVTPEQRERVQAALAVALVVVAVPVVGLALPYWALGEKASLHQLSAGITVLVAVMAASIAAAGPGKVNE
jgi:hypothetical protein